MDQIYFVYLLTFSNGKVYVGMSRTDKKGLFTVRFRAHAAAARKGKALPIYHAWRRYGAPGQAILSRHETREACAAAEIEEIRARQSCDPDYGYNLMRGGEGMHAPRGSAMHALMRSKVWDNPEVRAKLSAANKGKPPSKAALDAATLVRSDSPEWREKMREKVWENPEQRAARSEQTRLQMANGGGAHIAKIRREQGDRRTPEQVAAHAEKMRAWMNTPEGKAHARKGREAMAANPANMEKLRAGQERWRASERNKAQCKEMAKLSAQACRRRVRDLETGTEYESQRAMARALGVTEPLISLRVKAGKVLRV